MHSISIVSNTSHWVISFTIKSMNPSPLLLGTSCESTSQILQIHWIYIQFPGRSQRTRQEDGSITLNTFEELWVAAFVHTIIRSQDGICAIPDVREAFPQSSFSSIVGYSTFPVSPRTLGINLRQFLVRG